MLFASFPDWIEIESPEAAHENEGFGIPVKSR